MTTVAQLREMLKDMPDDAKVVVAIGCPKDTIWSDVEADVSVDSGDGSLVRLEGWTGHWVTWKEDA